MKKKKNINEIKFIFIFTNLNENFLENFNFSINNEKKENFNYYFNENIQISLNLISEFTDEILLFLFYLFLKKINKILNELNKRNYLFINNKWFNNNKKLYWDKENWCYF